MVRFGGNGVVIGRAGLHELNIKQPVRHTREWPYGLITYYGKYANGVEH